MNVFDSSALLAFIQGEGGATTVEAQLIEGGACSAANWSEIAQHVLAHGKNWDLIRALLDSYPLTVESVTRDDGEWAASRWRPGEGLSLGDRLCLALGERLDAQVWTADRTWGQGGRINQIRFLQRK